MEDTARWSLVAAESLTARQVVALPLILLGILLGQRRAAADVRRR